MHIRIRAGLLSALLCALAIPASAQQTYVTGPMTFQRGGHNQWGAPGDIGELDWQKVTDPQDISLGIGGFVGDSVGLDTGAELSFNITGQAGLTLRVLGRNGTISASYPMGVTLTYPDPRTIHPGDTFTIGSSFSRGSGGSLSTTSPDFALRVGAILKAAISVHIAAALSGLYFINDDIFTAGPYDFSTTLFDTDLPGFQQAVNKVDGNFTLLDGLITGTWGFPQVATSGGDGPGTTLVSSGTGDFLTMEFSITGAILYAFGVPPFEGFGSLHDGDVQYEIHLLDLFIKNDNGIHQDFTLTPKPTVFLQLSNGQTVSFNVGDTFNMTMPAATPGSATNDLTITPTFTMTGDVHNHSALRFGAGLFFNPLYGGLHVDFHDIITFDKGFGFSDIDLLGGEPSFDIDLIDKTFTMEGFNSVTTPAFTIEGYRYPAPALSSVSPTMLKLGQGASALTVNGTGFVDAYTNGSGTTPGSTVMWDGSPRATTFVNGQQLSAALLPSDIATEGKHNVTVANPSPGGGTTNALTVVVDGTAPAIASTATPNPLPKGGNPSTLISVTVSGSVTDALSGVDPFSVKYTVADEYGLLNSAGPITLNPDGTYSFVLRLSPAINKGDKDGRHYTITIQATDKVGNTGSKVITVVAPS